jgi:hypothetical protein
MQFVRALNVLVERLVDIVFGGLDPQNEIPPEGQIRMTGDHHRGNHLLERTPGDRQRLNIYNSIDSGFVCSHVFSFQ